MYKVTLSESGSSLDAEPCVMTDIHWFEKTHQVGKDDVAAL